MTYVGHSKHQLYHSFIYSNQQKKEMKKGLDRTAIDGTSKYDKWTEKKKKWVDYQQFIITVIISGC